MLNIQDADSLAVANEALMEGQEPVAKSLSVWELLTSGGLAGNIIMIILAVLLFVAIYLYIERTMALKEASKIDKGFMNQIRDHITHRRFDSAKLLCQHTNTPVSRLVEKGISRIGKPLEDINTAIENAGKLEIYNLEKNVSILATISGAGPMIGFLGTVVGMILVFFEIEKGGGQIQIDLLAGGIYTAMTTTVVGLIVGVFAYIGYNHLVVKTDKIVNQMEATAVEFLDLLNDPV
ncbi:MotA/TolQ/ExbB proton channel family protein [Flavobacterium coralii]|uniref:MotA/TolQ/ExbB proton channel family protein n=1 Tax=Flavobacterium coralii TaxID=2838017 RepID=UPI000C58AF1F|nr:MotA/TolQ/ExbB proton channel family protein [Flavobacterium coralii]MBE99923.1 biopolymer transporter ExbB [Flavobacterium sp.]MBY8963884.1 MotA/TolQ/ExbB proton channel family protein [Flavobacterium coralii]|tara:strand:- start:7456 stop:8163 length:708 start_codon:yes stop_codon:yes gene_type:complete